MHDWQRGGVQIAWDQHQRNMVVARRCISCAWLLIAVSSSRAAVSGVGGNNLVRARIFYKPSIFIAAFK